MRAFLFQQSRVESLFDSGLDRIHEIVERRLTENGAFHVKIHYSSSQLTCWFSDDTYRYRVYAREEVPVPGFIEQFRNGSINLINGMIGMSCSCDGAHYIDQKTFFEKLDTFATPGGEDPGPATASS